VELLALSLGICIVSHFSTFAEEGGVEGSCKEGVVLPRDAGYGGAGFRSLLRSH